MEHPFSYQSRQLCDKVSSSKLVRVLTRIALKNNQRDVPSQSNAHCCITNLHQDFPKTYLVEITTKEELTATLPQQLLKCSLRYSIRLPSYGLHKNILRNLSNEYATRKK